MKKNNGQVSRGRRVTDFAATAMEQVDLYCTAHPGSPSAMRRPRLSFRSELWIALFGPSVGEGIVGIGPTVAAALRAFDTRYLAGLRAPVEAMARRPARTRRRSGMSLCAPDAAQNLTDKVSDLAWPS